VVLVCSSGVEDVLRAEETVGVLGDGFRDVGDRDVGEVGGTVTFTGDDALLILNK